MISLPGIGRSTAGAILSLGSNLPYPILDANVKRVISRVFGVTGDLSKAENEKKLWNIVTSLLN